MPRRKRKRRSIEYGDDEDPDDVWDALEYVEDEYDDEEEEEEEGDDDDE
ncbi:MAG: hypothetical protein ACFFD2_18415 [Promethearchaeota archaeon]